eukprot:13563_1
MDFEFTADDLQGFEMYCDDNENNQVNKFQDFSICGSSDNKKLPVNEFQDLSLYCSSDNENNQNDDNQLPQIKYHESDGYNPGNILDNVHPHAIVDYSDEKTAQFMTHKLTSEEMYNKISKNPWYNVNHKDRAPKIIINPDDGSPLWQFEGKGWSYDDMDIKIPKKIIFESVVEATFNYEGEIIKLSIDSTGKANLNKLLSQSAIFNAQIPHVVLTQPRKAYIAEDLSSIRCDYYCSPGTCPLELYALLDFQREEGDCYVICLSCINGPCVHIPYEVTGIVRSGTDNSFGQNYGCIEFKNELLKHKNNECMKWGNYNHQIHSKNQSKQIKYKKNAVIKEKYESKDNFDRWNKKIYILARKFKDKEVAAAPDNITEYLDDTQIGFIHDHNANIPAVNLYIEGHFENLRLLGRTPLQFDDFANNMEKTHGQRPNTTVISIPNPNEGTGVIVAKMISFNWGNDYWEQQYAALWNRATCWGRRPIMVPVITADYDVGRITKLIRVHNKGMTRKKYHQITLEFCKQSVNLSQNDIIFKKLVATLIRICQNHIVKNIHLHYKGADLLQTLIASIWNFCYTTLKWNDWEFAIALGFHLSQEENEWIPFSDTIWNKVDYTKYISYNEKDIDKTFQLMYKKTHRNKLRAIYINNITQNKNIVSEYAKKK